jgi:hypothetical protein
LLGDSDKIRTERKKSRASKSKYTGVGSDESGFGGSGKKYGGFGSEDLSYGSYSGQVYGIHTTSHLPVQKAANPGKATAVDFRPGDIPAEVTFKTDLQGPNNTKNMTNSMTAEPELPPNEVLFLVDRPPRRKRRLLRRPRRRKSIYSVSMMMGHLRQRQRLLLSVLRR